MVTKTNNRMIVGAHVNVLDYNGDIQAALDTGFDVYVPEGAFQITTLTMSRPYQVLFGSGFKSVINGTLGQNGINVTDDYVQIVNLRMNGVDVSEANNNCAINITSNLVVVNNVSFNGSVAAQGWTNAVKFNDGSNYGLVTNCKFERLYGHTAGHGYGVLCGQGNGHVITENTFLGSVGRGRHAVYISSGASDCYVAGNLIKDFNREGISQDALASQPPCARNRYIGNTLINNCQDDNVTSGAIGIYRRSLDCIIQGNTIQNSGERGITVDVTGANDSVNTIISGNNISYSGGVGIAVTSTNGTIIEGNIVNDSGQKATGTYPNIHILNDGTNATTNTLVAGNICSQVSHSRSALSIDPTVSPVGLRINNNNFSSGSNGVIEFNGVDGVELDGRLQFALANVVVPSIASGTSHTQGITLQGVSGNDTAIVSHTSDSEGMLFSLELGTNQAVLTTANLSGAARGIASGTLTVDVFKRH